MVLKQLALLAAFVAVAVPAHAEPVSLAIGNAVFSGLYSIGVSGAIANAIANVAGVALLAAGSCVGGSTRSRK